MGDTDRGCRPVQGSGGTRRPSTHPPSLYGQARSGVLSVREEIHTKRRWLALNDTPKKALLVGVLVVAFKQKRTVCHRINAGLLRCLEPYAQGIGLGAARMLNFGYLCTRACAALGRKRLTGYHRPSTCHSKTASIRSTATSTARCHASAKPGSSSRHL